jgi:hypothetical protein
MSDPAVDRLTSLRITDPAYFDTLSGCVIRLFARLERLDGEFRALAQKLGRDKAETVPLPARPLTLPEPAPAKAGGEGGPVLEGVDVFGNPVRYVPKRGRGRPKGARNSSQGQRPPARYLRRCRASGPAGAAVAPSTRMPGAGRRREPGGAARSIAAVPHCGRKSAD